MFGRTNIRPVKNGLKLLIWLRLSARLVNRDEDLIATTDPLAGLFGYTHKDPERVYKLSRVKVCAPKTRPYKSRIKTEVTCLTVYTITPMH